MQLVPFPNDVVARSSVVLGGFYWTLSPKGPRCEARQLLTLGEEEREAVLNFFPMPRRLRHETSMIRTPNEDDFAY